MVERETQAHTLTLIPACKAVPRPCMAPGPGWKEEDKKKRGGEKEKYVHLNKCRKLLQQISFLFSKHFTIN